MTDDELLEEIKRRAKKCKHADDACKLVYFINNTVNSDAYWRDWHCEKRHYTGTGSIPDCPRCKQDW
jgi:hypothetical protein